MAVTQINITEIPKGQIICITLYDKVNLLIAQTLF